MPGPLAGIRVIDISAVLSGPLATMLLADQGADVVKIEPPGLGDLLRIGGYRRAGMNAFFLGANRGKRSIVLDLEQPRAREIVVDLVRTADVFVQNFRPGAIDRLGLGEPALRRVQPDLIYVSISGFGESGPYADRRVYDPVVQGLTGHVAVQENPEVPIRDLVRNAISDKSTSYTAAQAITAALFARERGAGGQHLRVPMLDSSLAFFWPDGMMAHALLGDDVEPGPTLYQVYRLTETADGQLIYFAASDAEVQGLFRALGRPELCDDARFTTAAARRAHAGELGAELFAEFPRWTTAELLERLVAEQVPCGPVHALEELLEDPQVSHNGTIRERAHPVYGRYREVRPAARFDRTAAPPGDPAPLPGEHADEILAELGYDAAGRATLRAEGVLG
jgi:crotonobetainyl-CoA:carnitine CoA-transferase CaiB-like acyl-CoA transferase